jgi:hypothetical protein
MKTVELFEDFDYHAHRRKTVRFHAGTTYSRVLELAAQEIERKGAGRIVNTPGDVVGDIVDARHAFRPRLGHGF